MSAIAEALAWCGPATASASALLLAGLVGGPAHCGPMCGPFVLAQAADRMARVPAAKLCEAHRVRSGLLLPYHAGRLATYGALGAISGAAGGLLPTGNSGAVAPWLTLIAAILFAAQALARIRPRWAAMLPRPPAFLARSVGLWSRKLPFGGRGSFAGTFLIGVMLGFLPCGMLLAAITAAGASGGAVDGAVAMLAFGAGTVPALAVVGIAGHAVSRAAWLPRGTGPAFLLACSALLGAISAHQILL